MEIVPLVFLAFTLKLPIQTSLSVATKLQVCVCLGEKCRIFRKTSTLLIKVDDILTVKEQIVTMSQNLLTMNNIN